VLKQFFATVAVVPQLNVNHDIPVVDGGTHATPRLHWPAAAAALDATM
jgi:hypothetical protein